MATSSNAFSIGRSIKNLGVNIVLYCVNLTSGIVLTPVIIKYIGIDAYSYYPLMMTFSTIIILIMSALTYTYSNFFSVAFHKDTLEALRIFSTCNIASLALAAGIAPLIVLFALGIEHVIVIPSNLVSDVRLFYLFVMTSALISLIEAGISVVTFSMNRIDLRNLSQIGNKLLFFCGSLALLRLGGGRLAFVGLSMFAGALFSLGASIYYWRTLLPKAAITLARFDKAILKSVGQTSFWVLMTHIGASFLELMDLFFINIYWGSGAGAIYGAVAQAALAIRMLAWMVAQVALPKAAQLYAVSQTRELPGYLASFQNGLALLLGFTIGILISYSGDILTIWLGPSLAQETITPFAVVLGLLLPNIVGLPAFLVFPILNKVRVPGMVTLGLGGLYLVILAGLGLIDSKQPILVPVIGGIILVFKNAVFAPLYCARLLGGGASRLLNCQLLGLAGAGSCFAFSRAASFLVSPNTITGLLANVVLIGALSAPLLLLSAPRAQRAAAFSYMRNVFRRS